MSRHPDPDDAAIGGRLRQARTEARITQAEAAAALGIPRSAVSELEAGTRRLAAAELARCAAPYRLRPPGSSTTPLRLAGRRKHWPASPPPCPRPTRRP